MTLASPYFSRSDVLSVEISDFQGIMRSKTETPCGTSLWLLASYS